MLHSLNYSCKLDKKTHDRKMFENRFYAEIVTLQHSRESHLQILFRFRGRPQNTSAVRGEWVCPVRTLCGQGGRGSSDADVRTSWRKKLRIFLEIYGVSARTRGGGG